MTIRVPFGASAALAVALTLPACSQPAAAASKQPTPVKVQAVLPGPNTSDLRCTKHCQELPGRRVAG